MSIYNNKIFNNDCGVATQVCLDRRITGNFTINPFIVCLTRNPIISDGVVVTIDQDGEWFNL